MECCKNLALKCYNENILTCILTTLLVGRSVLMWRVKWTYSPAWSILKLLGKRKNESEIPLSGIQESKLSDSIFSFGRKSLGSQVSSSLSVFHFHVVLELIVSGMENKR